MHLADMLYRQGLLSAMDKHFADLMQRLAGSRASPELYLGCLLASSVTTDEQHTCLDLKSRAGKPAGEVFPAAAGIDASKAVFPECTIWRKKLLRSGVVGRPGGYFPLILDGQDRLYLYRYWDYEQNLVQQIRSRLTENGFCTHCLPSPAQMKRVFSYAPCTPDRQKIAAFSALTHGFCVVSGGPGTGKTHTIAGIAALLLEQDPGCRIRMCAPTGKAAARLHETLKQAKQRMKESDHMACSVFDDASTIHRLLGTRGHSPYFRHNRDNPLPLDVLIVDEASMVPLALMAKLMESLPPEARVVLLGDKDQLASVETGALLADICEAAGSKSYTKKFCTAYTQASGEELTPGTATTGTSSALADCMVELTHSYRFASERGIGAVSRAINAGDAPAALDILRCDTTGALSCCVLPDRQEILSRLAPVVKQWYGPVFSAAGVGEAFACFERFRVLCCLRGGSFGVESINTAVETILEAEGIIKGTSRYYKGRPVMITSNDYTLKLYNGDIGLVWETERGEFQVFFPDREGSFRSISPVRLPGHETVYAMTVHKSQGSEFDHVLLVLPDRDTRVMTRELLYTGITRARIHATVWMQQGVFMAAVGRRTERTSGLRDALVQL